MKKILVVCGPTATGKTSLAVSLAEKFNGEIISADSRQVYQGLDIGTGKDKEKISVPVWLLDVISPKFQFSVFDWFKLAEKKITDIWKRGKLPIVVGGTGLYIKALVDGIGTLDISPDKRLRMELNKLGVKELQLRLKNLSPDVFNNLNHSDKNNPRRLIRKIEIVLSGDKKDFANKGGVKADFLMVGLTAPRDVLYQRIDHRVKQRIESGLVDEIKGLLDRGIAWDNPGMNTLAYKEFKPFFEGKLSLEDAIERWKFNEHAYARRQLTWFKRDKRIRWFNLTGNALKRRVTRFVEKWYSKENGFKSKKN